MEATQLAIDNEKVDGIGTVLKHAACDAIVMSDGIKNAMETEQKQSINQDESQ